MLHYDYESVLPYTGTFQNLLATSSNYQNLLETTRDFYTFAYYWTIDPVTLGYRTCAHSRDCHIA